MNESQIFTDALKLASASERAAYLEAVCAGNPQLRVAVESLLQAHESDPAFLEKSAGSLGGTIDSPAAAPTPSPGETVGTVIGPYKLIEPIGEGGMGIVWMAQQAIPVKRLVAVKLIKAGMDTKQVIARFEAERQALALMDHPNIARVLDGGTTSTGRPYFVMDLVKGVPITRYCDEHHLTPRQRLELFIPVCQAIQHAHQKGVIHRDLKPSNVMVALYDGKPVPKVIDFGVAKATGQQLSEKTLITGFGAIVGTLEYMSPEQAEINQLDIDTRSDIYSLGVLLYELLAGSPPFSKKELERAGMLEMLRVIREQEPSKPSTKLSTAEGLPALAANRGMEPAKLTKLVRGELDWMVMKALEKDRSRRYETANGFAMDVQRYLAGEAVQAVPPSTGYRLRKFMRRNRGSLAAAVILGVALAVATGGVAWAIRDRAAQQAVREAEINLFLNRAEELYGDARLTEALAEAQKARGLLPSDGGSNELGQRVRSCVADLEMALRLEELSTQWYDHGDYTRVTSDLARSLVEYGINVEAMSEEEAVARIIASRIRAELIGSLRRWAARLESHPQKPELERAGRLRRIETAADPDPFLVRVRAAVRGGPTKDLQTLRALTGSVDVATTPVRRLTTLAGALQSAGLRAEAIAFLQRVQRVYPADFITNFNLGSELTKNSPPHWREAVGYFRAALAVRPHSARTFSVLGWCLSRQGEWDEALAACSKAVRLQPNYSSCHHYLGVVLHEKGDFDGAVVALREAIRLDPDNSDFHTRLGAVLLAKGDFEGALAEYREAVQLKPDDVVAQSGIGATFRNKALNGGGEEAWNASLAAYQEAARINPDHRFVVYGRAYVLHDKGDLESAVAAFRDAFKKWPKDRQQVEYSERAANAMNSLAWGLATDLDPSRRNPERAVELAREAVELVPKDAAHWNTLGVAYYRARQFVEATTALRKAMELAQGGDAYDWYFMAMALCKLGQKDEARTLYDRAVKWKPKPGIKDEEEAKELLRFQAEAAQLLGIDSKKD